MQLSKIVKKINGLIAEGSAETEISGIVYDSRQAYKGCLFCCVSGFKTDGHEFIGEAVRKGAVAVCIEREVAVPRGITIIRVSDSREALSVISSEFYDNPSAKLNLIGVTGTNGKTTTSFLIEELLNRSGKKTGLIGTLCVKIGSETRDVKFTTPESTELHRTLSEMVACKMENAVMEVSSHALSLKRVSSCLFSRAVFTNITQDHLDFHKNMDEYFNSKLELFSLLSRNSETTYDPLAVLNSDDQRTKEIINFLKKSNISFITYAVKDEKADYRAVNVNVKPEGVEYDLICPEGERHIKLQISGFFNVYNSLASIAVGASFSIPINTLTGIIEEFKGVKGRFQMVKCGQAFAVAVDYAHTPDGLLNILKSAREITSGSLITVFGCGGDRDRKKRAVMGEIAANLSDVIIITSDNPRTEDPESIIRDIEQGVPFSKKFEKIIDRKLAIFKALEIAEKGDTVIIAGKGHENYQIFRDKTIHFDDAEVVEEFFRLRAVK